MAAATPPAWPPRLGHITLLKDVPRRAIRRRDTPQLARRCQEGAGVISQSC